MVDLKAVPFCLSDDDIAWVENTIAGMTLEEKIGQLFIVLANRKDEDYLRHQVEDFHVGGSRYTGGTSREIYEQNKTYQRLAKIPLLIAANCEQGGSGSCSDGTYVASEPACGACADTQTAYNMGYVSGREATAIGCNWTFAPISDILFNWRNTIVNNRAFGRDVDKVIACAKAYIEGAHQSNILCTAKHFPGDGSEERDQHLVMGCNDLSCDEWDASYGRVYRSLIESGLETIMVGHICQPAYQRHFHPGLEDRDILPATLCPELLQNLLRGQLGFNGLILTDASHMAGMTNAATRYKQVTGAISAGCDMFLFFDPSGEEQKYLREGLECGDVTPQRLDDALHRILGMKAKLGLHKKQAAGIFAADESALACVGCEEHHKLAAQAADSSITLVKDTQNLLPVDPARYKRARLYFIESAPKTARSKGDPARQLVIDELKAAGFEVDVQCNYYELARSNTDANIDELITASDNYEDFRSKYDIVFYFVNMRGYAKENNVRITYSAGHSAETPWWTKIVPTVCVSLNYTNHLYDLPMMQTYINAYSDTAEYIHAVVEKICGKSPFKGSYDENVWCGRWDTRL